MTQTLGGEGVTDLATKPGADEASNDVDPDGAAAGLEEPAAGTEGPGAGSPTYAWAPTDPTPRKPRRALWIGVGAGAAVVALVAASLVLIAPGTSVGGVNVGLSTQGAAIDALQSRLDETTIVLTGAGGDAEVTGADLGATVDARALAETAFAEHPAWNFSTWFAKPVDAVVRIDPARATAALRAAAPGLYSDPVDATLAYDATTASYVTTPGVDGAGIDVDAVRLALQDAYAAGTSRVKLDAGVSPVAPHTPTYVAAATAARLNGILATAGFYVGAERTVPVDPATAASWITVTPTERGTFDISVDASGVAAIQAVVDTLPAAVDRAPVNATVITNSAGKVLRNLASGETGRSLDDTGTIAADYAKQLAAGQGAFELPVTETAFTTTSLVRTVEVNLSTQRAYLYENGTLVKDMIIASGKPGTVTPQGRFTVFGYSSSQNMGCFKDAPYCVENVPWVTWFAPNIGFHGANALRTSLGYPQSHGCVNMWDADAKFVYDWTVPGTEVWVHA